MYICMLVVSGERFVGVYLMSPRIKCLNLVLTTKIYCKTSVKFFIVRYKSFLFSFKMKFIMTLQGLDMQFFMLYEYKCYTFWEIHVA